MQAFLLCVLAVGSGEGFSREECAGYEQMPDVQSGIVVARRLDELRAGDIVLCTSWNPAVVAVFSAMTWCPITHVLIVVHDDEGRLCVLDADQGTGVQLLPAVGYLRAYCAHGGTVHVRHLDSKRRPVTLEEDRRLTEFALAQVGKQYAPIKRFGKILREPLFLDNADPAHLLALDRMNWFCSEIVAGALQYAHMISPKVNVGAISPKHFTVKILRNNEDRWASPLPYAMYKR